jgi:hypothetical protein
MRIGIFLPLVPINMHFPLVMWINGQEHWPDVKSMAGNNNGCYALKEALVERPVTTWWNGMVSHGMVSHPTKSIP